MAKAFLLHLLASRIDCHLKNVYWKVETAFRVTSEQGAENREQRAENRGENESGMCERFPVPSSSLREDRGAPHHATLIPDSRSDPGDSSISL